MYDLLDFFTPRVYVLSEKHYEEHMKKRRKAEKDALIARRERLAESLAEIDKELKGLE